MVITKLNRSLAKQDPEGTFESPLVIVDETMFTRGEKIATLDRWRQSILAELTEVDVLEKLDHAKLKNAKNLMKIFSIADSPYFSPHILSTGFHTLGISGRKSWSPSAAEHPAKPLTASPGSSGG